MSIIIPSFNRAELLRRSIVSVLAQTFRDFELIVVDDASSDGTRDVVESFADKRICYLCHDQNLGAPAARNTGIRAARGQYIAFQDSDDEWLPEKLARQVQMLDAAPSDVGVVYCGYLRWDGEQARYVPSHHIPFKEGDLSVHILRKSFIGTPTLLIRKECFNQLQEGFDERLPRFQEWELLIRLAAITRFRVIDEPLVLEHDTPGSLISNKPALVEAREIIFEKHREALERSPEILVTHYCDIGHAQCLYQSCTAGRQWFQKALHADKGNFKAWVGFLMSCLGRQGYTFVLKALGRNVDG